MVVDYSCCKNGEYEIRSKILPLLFSYHLVYEI